MKYGWLGPWCSGSLPRLEATSWNSSHTYTCSHTHIFTAGDLRPQGKNNLIYHTTRLSAIRQSLYNTTNFSLSISLCLSLSHTQTNTQRCNHSQTHCQTQNCYYLSLGTHTHTHSQKHISQIHILHKQTQSNRVQKKCSSTQRECKESYK